MANVSILRSNIEKIDIVCESMTATEVYNRYKPDYFINLGLWDFNTGKNIQYLKDENKKSGYLFSNEGIGIKGKTDIIWTTKDKAYKDQEIRDFISGSPTLLKDGSRFINWGNKVGSHANGAHKRSIVGFNDENLILLCTDNTLSIENSVKTALSLRMKYAINVDGGGSCHLQDGNKALVRSTRRNASWLLVYTKKQNQSENKVNYYEVKRGDTLSRIAEIFGMNYKKIAKDNAINSPYIIKVGQKLKIIK